MVRQAYGLSPSFSLILASAFWGIGTVLSKELLGSVPPVLFLIVQLAPSVLLLWLIVLASKHPLMIGKTLVPIILLGLLNPGISYTLSMLGLVHTSASVATLIWSAEPALIVALAWIVLREKISLGLIVLTITAACGVVLASGAIGLGNALTGNAYGPSLILAGVLCCAFYTVMSRGIAAEIDPLIIVTVQQSAGLAWTLAIWPLELQGNAFDQLRALSSGADCPVGPALQTWCATDSRKMRGVAYPELTSQDGSNQRSASPS